jgi:hypothetical protein
MDFIISKVAMSICALIIASILSGLFAKEALFEPWDELKGVVREFCSFADQVALSGAEADVVWIVPFKADRSTLSLTLKDFMVIGESDNHKSIDQTACMLRTWAFEDCVLNSTVVEALDKAMPSISAKSGSAIGLSSRAATVDGVQTTLVFASLKD